MVGKVSVCPPKRAFHRSFPSFLAAAAEVDDHCSIIHSEHEVIGRNTLGDDTKATEVLNAFVDPLETSLYIERSSIMIDALDQVLVVPSEAETRYAISFDNATVISSDIRVRTVHESLTDSSFSKHKFTQTSWIA